MINSIKDLRSDIKHSMFFITSLLFAVIVFTDTLLYYKEVVPNNFLAGCLFPVSVFFLIFAFCDLGKIKLPAVNKKLLIFAAVLTVVYFASHVFDYEHLPWNNYGLFDDAGWDIYLSREKCFSNDIFEIIFWDEGIGRISRELLFHYYISIFFRLFGYNMFTFNMALTILGYITVLFTFLLAYEISGKLPAALMTGIFLNYLPLNYTQVYMGHRYAICGPVMMISVYFLYKAFKKRKTIDFVIGGIFAGLTLESSIMGKQYIWGLLAALVVSIIFLWIKKNLKAVKACYKGFISMILGFLTVTAPFFAYVFTHWEIYNIREKSLSEEFFKKLEETGFDAVKENLKILYDTFFAESSGSRQFSMGYPVLTVGMVIFLIAGIVFALRKKHILSIFMILIPLAGNIVTICYDFRLLISAPYMSLLIVWGVCELCEIFSDKILKNKYKVAAVATSGIILFLLIYSPVFYINDLKKDPNSQRYLYHPDLAASRFIQDVVGGADEYNIDMEDNEFNRPVINNDSDVYALTLTSYAHVHAFLQQYDDYKILGMFGNFPYVGTDPNDLRETFRNNLAAYQPVGKRLRLVVEYNDKFDQINDDIMSSGLAEYEEYKFFIDGNTMKMVIYNIAPENIQAFKEHIERV